MTIASRLRAALGWIVIAVLAGVAVALGTILIAGVSVADEAGSSIGVQAVKVTGDPHPVSGTAESSAAPGLEAGGVGAADSDTADTTSPDTQVVAAPEPISVTLDDHGGASGSDGGGSESGSSGGSGSSNGSGSSGGSGGSGSNSGSSGGGSK